LTTGTTATETTTQMLNNLQAQVAAISLCLNPAPIPSQEAYIQEITAQLNQSIANLPALIQQQIQAMLHSPDFSAAVTKTIRSEILSLQPPYSQSEESSSEDE
jgi:predicted component of type VI protein secretion system